MDGIITIEIAVRGRAMSHPDEEVAMRKAFLLLALLLGSFWANSFGFVPDDLRDHPSCKYCGMDREKFAQSRMLLEYEDSSTVGTCSIHCSAVDLSLNVDKTPKAIMVGDYGTRRLIDAEKAFWVIGGSKPGVMTKRGKWAFEKETDAMSFVKENGGELSSFDEAMKAAYADMYEDTKMIREKRKTRRMEHHKH